MILSDENGYFLKIQIVDRHDHDFGSHVRNASLTRRRKTERAGCRLKCGAFISGNE